MQPERGEVLELAQQVQRSRQPQAQLVLVQRYALDLAEALGQVDRRHADLRRNLGQGPAPRQVARQHQLGPVHQALAAMAGGSRMGGARRQRAMDKSERQALALQRLGDARVQRVAQHRHQHLRAWIDAQA